MFRYTIEQKIHYTLRLAIAMCFIGHGAFGIITKAIWCNYLAVFGIDHDHAYRLMPWVGIIDILLGVTMLIYPIRAIAIWLIIWGTITALLRPLSGEPFAEFIERAGNFGAPLVLLAVYGTGQNGKSWFIKLNSNPDIDASTYFRLGILLRVMGFCLLLGHGWLNLIEKSSLLNQYSSLGFSNPGMTAHAIGIFEIVSACTILVYPIRSVLLIVFIWKILSELFYPHYELFEWIERGGSYGVLLALWFASKAIPDREFKLSV